MKNLLSILIFILQTSFVFGQINSFAPLGSSWYYSHYFFTQYGQDFTKIETIGDTVIDGKICSIIYINNAYINADEFPDSIFVHYENGKVFRYFNQWDKWGLQYDFNSNVGDTLLVYGSAFTLLDSFNVVVDSVYSSIINGIVTTHFTYRDLTIEWEFDQVVIEGIGGTNFLFPTWTLAENTNIGLRCYSDSIIGYYNSGLVSSCDTIISVVHEVNSLTGYSITPSIFQKEIRIENQQSETLSIRIINESNKIFGDYLIVPLQSVIINLEALPDGFYFAISNTLKNREVKKLIKISNK